MQDCRTGLGKRVRGTSLTLDPGRKDSVVGTGVGTRWVCLDQWRLESSLKEEYNGRGVLK